MAVLKAEYGRQIPRRLNVNLKPSILDGRDRKSLLTQLSRNVGNVLKQEKNLKIGGTRETLEI